MNPFEGLLYWEILEPVHRDFVVVVNVKMPGEVGIMGTFDADIDSEFCKWQNDEIENWHCICRTKDLEVARKMAMLYVTFIAMGGQ